ncbi:Phage tail sheath protein [Desulfitobacterium dehalogenans ATCC 51507]|uniref:Phage tail sheath protein n=1 Tax=Desulfitobacterium dehalogenans (strain ATCC 51507 / DSM 9161 / JW/IU-DC1) TaxID=756499 RepID=I4A6D8_DESDJ|nr:phage tail sheath family protein [Desulfitobacterium dehalogenans]AFL99522.1 Phage tail sheath protein [Desulfitobacterium dehalogenans ATCC 51507]
MAAGTFTAQNKVRPGVYINFKSEPQAIGTLGERGIASIPLAMSWGESNKVLTIEAGEDVFTKLGYSIMDPTLLLLREALKRARTVLLYRLNVGTKAAVTVGNLTATAKWGGVRGNDISVVIQENIDDETKFDVSTLVDGVEIDKQTVSTIAGLTANDWVVFSGTGTITETAGAPLIGGADGTVSNQAYIDYLAAVEIFDFNTIALPSTDDALKATFTAFAKRLRDDEGKKVQVVMENYPAADYEGVISVKNGVVLSDGTTLTAAQATAWVAGATAGAQVNESLTYQGYEGAVDVSPRYTNAQIIAALQAGEFLFTANDNRALVEQDINTLTSFTVDKGKQFAKNRVIRVLDGVNNDFVRIFSEFYIGKVSNNADGRNLLKSECINYMNTLQGIDAIQNFDSQSDVTVQAGNEVDAVYIETNIQPVDSVEKLYIRVRIR